MGGRVGNGSALGGRAGTEWVALDGLAIGRHWVVRRRVDIG